MPFSFLNGLGAMGASVAQFAGSAGLELQRSQLSQQAQILADQLATTRETGLQDKRQTFQAGENVRNRAATAENLQAEIKSREGTSAATIAAENSRAADNRANQLELEKMRLNQDPDSIRIIRLLDPKAIPARGGSASDAPAKSSPAPGDSSSQPQPTSQDAPSPQARGPAADLLDKAYARPGLGSMERARYEHAMDVAKEHPDWTGGQKSAETERRVTESYGGLSTDAKEQIADRLIAGDQGALSGLGYGNAGAANRAAVQDIVAAKLKAQGKGGADLAAQTSAYMGERAGARTAGTREANVGMAVTEAQLFMPLALEASKKVSRTSFPTLNSILLAAEKGTGGEDVVRLAVATNSLVNAYSRAITPSGIPTEGNQNRARELLDKAWSAGQYEAAVDQLSKEMSAAKQSPIQQQQEQRARISGTPTPSTTAPAPAAAANGGWTVKRID